MRRGIVVTLVGAGVAIAAFLTYFLVAPSWPDWRDSGAVNVFVAVGGSLLALFGWFRVRGGRRARVLAASLSITSVCMTGFLAVYIFYLSWQLPSAGGAPDRGEQAPSLALVDSRGEEWNLSERGVDRWLVLDFFRGHW